MTRYVSKVGGAKRKICSYFWIINAMFILLSWLGVNDNLIYVIKYSNYFWNASLIYPCTLLSFKIGDKL